MEENNSYKQLDDLIRSRFEGAEEIPSDSAWAGIEQQLDQKGKKRPGFIFWLSGLLLVAVTAGTIWFFRQNAELKQALAEADSKAQATVAGEKIPSVNGRTISMIDAETRPASAVNVNGKENRKETSGAHPGDAAPLINNENTQTSGDPVIGYVSLKGNPGKSSITKEATTASFAVNNNKAISSTVKETNEKTTAVKTTDNRSSLPTSETSHSLEPLKDIAVNNSHTAGEAGTPTDQRYSANKEAAAEKIRKDSTEKFNALQQQLIVRQKQQEVELKKQEEEKQKQETEQKIAAEQKLILQASSDSLATIAKKENKDSTEVKKDSVKTVALLTPAIPKSDSINPAGDMLKWMLSLYFSPEYYQNSVKQDDNTGQAAGDEKRIPRFTTGVKLSYMILDKLSVRLGVSYSELKQVLDEHRILFDRYQTEPYVFHSSLGDMPVDMATMKDGFSAMAPPFITQFFLNYSYRQSVQFINMPLELKYGFNFKWFGVSVMAGVNGQYAFHSHGELVLHKENNSNTIQYDYLDINKLSFAGTGGLSFSFALSKRLSLFVEPNVRYNFKQFGKSQGVSASPLFYGVNGGVGFRF